MKLKIGFIPHKSPKPMTMMTIGTETCIHGDGALAGILDGTGVGETGTGIMMGI